MRFPTRFLIVSESVLLFLLIICNFRSFLPAKVFSATTHIVISQIQIAGTGNTNQEFVELYNPTETSVDLSGWRLSKESSSGASLSNLVASMTGAIGPHGYFLVAHPQYANPPLSIGLVYSSSSSGIANNNSVILFNDAGHTVIDKIGMGLAVDNETADAPNPAMNESIIRKASDTSTVESLSPGGLEEFSGNGFDSDNNANDFILFTAANPRNSNTPQSPPMSTPSIAPSPTNTPTPTTTTTPAVTPTETQTPTPANSPTPTSTTPQPTEIPTPTPVPPTTVTPTPTPFIIQQFPFPHGKIVCSWSTKTLTTGGFRFFLPIVQCKTVRVPNQ